MSGYADADVVIPPSPDEVLTAQEGDFFMAARSGELIDWTQDISSGQGYGFDSLSHLFEQAFFFRTDTDGFNAAEHRLDELTLTDLGQVNPATSEFEGDSTFFSFGGQAGEPIQVDLEYELAGNSFSDTPMSSITKRLNITNTSGGDLQLAWFLYTDLDLEGNPAGDLGQLFSANTIRQTSSIGSFVDTRVASGDNPNAFSIEPFADIVDALEDDQVTSTLANQTLSGPGDVTHGFLWNFSLNAGESEQLEIVTEGTFTAVVAPDFQSSDPDDPTPSFNFDVSDPPIIGDRPVWYDPAVAIGYEYAIEDFGNNAFAEVYLPFFGDGEYTLIILDEDHPLFGEEIIVDAADVSGDEPIPSFDLTYIDEFDDLRGARAFQILGIEPFVEIDPEDPTGFPTGLTFIDSDFTSFSQTAIIPEPASLVLAGLAGAVMLLRPGRRRR